MKPGELAEYVYELEKSASDAKRQELIEKIAGWGAAWKGAKAIGGELFGAAKGIGKDIGAGFSLARGAAKGAKGTRAAGVKAAGGATASSIASRLKGLSTGAKVTGTGIGTGAVGYMAG